VLDRGLSHTRLHQQGAQTQAERDKEVEMERQMEQSALNQKRQELFVCPYQPEYD
jgi:hypothetical protein